MSTNLQLALEDYWSTNPKQKSLISTSLFKYCLPELGLNLSEKSKSRITLEDKRLALDFAKTIEVNKEAINLLITSQNSLLNNLKIKSGSKRQHRKNLNKFVNYLNSHYLSESANLRRRKSTTPQEIIAIIGINSKKHLPQTLSSSFKKKRLNNKKYILSLNPNDYPQKSKGDFARLKKDIEGFSKFIENYSGGKNKRSSETNKIRYDNLLRFLGWMYNIKKLELNQITFDKIIPVFNVNPNFDDFDSIEDFYINEGKIKHKARKNSNFTVNLIQEFFSDLNIKSHGTRFNYIVSIIDLAKYLYRDITDTFWAENYEDIPVIARLRLYLRKLPEDKKQIESELIKWDSVLLVLEELRKYADLKFTVSKRNKPRRGSGYEKHHRTESAIAKSLQNFIALAMLTLVPPSRIRVLKELSIGTTIKHGLFIGDKFVCKDNLENPSFAKYYIHLQPEDYKTGNTYGEWLGEFPDFQFKDGKKFYDYLDKWIYHYRDLLINQYKKSEDADHKFFFVKDRSGKRCDRSTLSTKITSIFKTLINADVSPHKLRTIFRTYLVNKGASQAELESAAFWMRHSGETAKKTYTKQSLDEKLAPGAAIAQKLNSELLNNSLDTSV